VTATISPNQPLARTEQIGETEPTSTGRLKSGAANNANRNTLILYTNKDFNNFWRCWKKKTCNKSQRTFNVAGCTAYINIANEFAISSSTVNS